jgi:hypothetical protein
MVIRAAQKLAFTPPWVRRTSPNVVPAQARADEVIE